MQHLVKISFLMLAYSLVISSLLAQKKVKTFTVEKVIPHPAEKVWTVVGEDYGAIAYSHPKIVYSEYINGTLKAGEGAERVCNFNEKGTQYLKEKMVNYDPENFTFINKVFQAGKFPVDPDYTQAVYKIIPIDDNSCRFVFDMQYRTKPAFIGGMMKKNFLGLINDYAIAIQHHVSTGEKVTKENFKEVKKQYATK